jgi:replicative DNA helicase
MDNDPAGKDALNKLTEGLESRNIPFYIANISGDHKDPNEALQSDRTAFTQAVANATKEARHIQAEAERLRAEEDEAKKQDYLEKTCTAHHLQAFLNEIQDSVNTTAISTGFTRLDETLEGGLYKGLYTIGAISSLGKTTLITQIADQIATTGQDVLIFSLEMARSELMAKSISRNTARILYSKENEKLRDKDPKKILFDDAKTALGITMGGRYAYYTNKEKDLINKAIETYKQTAEHLYIIEGIGDIGAKEIREAVHLHKKLTGNTPVVIIDYIQILAPYNERYSDKQNTDKAVLELKRLSRDYQTPVIGISSLNRASYEDEVTMKAFKESGAIEYSSDVLIGLQFKREEGKDFNATEYKKKYPREIELVVLKNRNGRVGDTIEYKYYPRFNYFNEQP